MLSRAGTVLLAAFNAREPEAGDPPSPTAYSLMSCGECQYREPSRPPQNVIADNNNKSVSSCMFYFPARISGIISFAVQGMSSNLLLEGTVSIGGHKAAGCGRRCCPGS